MGPAKRRQGISRVEPPLRVVKRLSQAGFRLFAPSTLDRYWKLDYRSRFGFDLLCLLRRGIVRTCSLTFCHSFPFLLPSLHFQLRSQQTITSYGCQPKARGTEVAGSVMSKSIVTSTSLMTSQESRKERVKRQGIHLELVSTHVV